MKIPFYAGRDASCAWAGAIEMSSIGAGFAAPCFQLLRFLTKPPVAAPLLIVATVVILINGYRFAKFSLWCIFTCGVCSF